MPRRLGQHFLFDRAILDRIVDALVPGPQDVVLEIGPGAGTLTRRLAPRVGSVVAIEKDRALVEQLRSGVDDALPENVVVMEGDALAVSWDVVVSEALGGSGRGGGRDDPRGDGRDGRDGDRDEPGGDGRDGRDGRAAGGGGEAAGHPPSTIGHPIKVVGNIPYYITSPLIERALEPPLPAVVVFLVQREVADRVVAGPGGRTYGALSVGVQAVARAERLFVVRAGAFRPPPKVDSAVLRLTPLDHPVVEEAERLAFRRFVVGLFSQRRKQLGRALRDIAGLEAAGAAGACAAVGVPPTARPENLDVAAFARLFRHVTR